MSGGIEIEIIGDFVGVEEMLTKVTASLSLQSMLTFQSTEVVPILQKRAKQRFAGEGDDAVGQWAPLMDATIAIRQTQGYGSGPINHRTGQMENYITGGGGQLKAISGDTELTWPKPPTNATIEAKITTAQVGKSFPPTVARPVVGVSETDLQLVLAALTDHVLLGMGADAL